MLPEFYTPSLTRSQTNSRCRVTRLLPSDGDLATDRRRSVSNPLAPFTQHELDARAAAR